jgi:hypothetical protein
MLTLDVIAKDLAMTLGSSFAKTFSSFAASGHVDDLWIDVTLYKYQMRVIL